MRNVELKARLNSIEEARRVARNLDCRPQPSEHQVDTYFCCREGRLKLREINGTTAQLIAYSRPDQNEAKQSDYQIVDVPDPARLKLALRQTLGIIQIVDKQREILLYQFVRIHLDQVKDLGDFIEFEAVLGDEHSYEAGVAIVERLKSEFALTNAQLQAGSYSDLLAD